MRYYNSDGFESTMCGNGGRCSSAFAIKEKIAGNNLIFKAIDGVHKATMEGDIIRLQMNDVQEPQLIKGNYFINTGSPHCVIFRKEINKIDVNSEGKTIRWSKDYAPAGTNVNFVEILEKVIYVRTFERGVEEETLSCGTGVTASAIASVLAGQIDINPVKVMTKGGNLSVSFKIEGKNITDIWLSGPATFVFEGMIKV
jgi:diaminopimelate epimerase